MTAREGVTGRGAYGRFNGLEGGIDDPRTFNAEGHFKALRGESGKEENERANSLDLGDSSKSVREWLAPHWGFQHGGWFVKEVNEGSIAEKAGLQVHDLIIAVDGVLVADDRYIVEKGKLKLLDGQPITVTIERPGTEGTIDLLFEPETATASTD